MAIWQLIPFVVFFGCVVSQFWFVRRVRIALIDRHPDEFLKLMRSSVFADYFLSKFILSRRHHELKDDELSRAVIRCRWLIGLAILAWLAFAITLIVAPPG